ncbi:MAG TPA: hypothetical protein VFF73_20395, partial [Planctomycetota bacterium]|nr:hypothetical protein [Planctomycetota bacterium]
MLPFAVMRVLGSLLVVLVAAQSAYAEGPDPAKVKSAIDKGVEWLKKRQSPDGSFPVEAVSDEKDAIGRSESHHLEGTTALALLALLKCGVKPDDPIINKGFDFLMEREPTSTYSVSLEILALEARFQPSTQQVEKEKRPYATVAHDRFAKIARPEDKKWLDDLVKWLLSKQQTSVWRYPSGPDADSNQDNSCTQYAVMALKAGARLGADVPIETWKKVAEYFVAQQDATGPSFDVFRVPAADGSIVAPPAPGKTADKSKQAT